MDQQQLAALLKELQIPDTQRLKAVTSELQKNYYSRPESLLALIEIIATNDDPSLRQQAAVEAARLANKHWKNVDGATKVKARQSLLQTTMQEQNAKCRHAVSRVISAIGTLDLSAEDKAAEWPELVPGLVTLATSSDAGQREVGSYILHCLLDENPINLEKQAGSLMDLFAQTIKDPQSADVRINTLMSVGSILLLISPDEEPALVKQLHVLIPGMVDVLKDTIQTQDEEKTQQAFEVFQSFLGYDPALLGPFLKDLLLFVLNDIAVNTQIESSVRAQAISFLNQAVYYRRTKILGMRDMGQQMAAKSIEILVEMDEEEEKDDETTPAGAACELLNELSQNLPPQQVINPLLEVLPKLSGSEDPKYRKAAMLALGTVIDGSPEFINSQMPTIMPHVIKLLNDPDASVRLTTLRALSAVAEELGQEIAQYNEALLTGIVKNLQAATSTPASDEKTAQMNVDTLRRVCLAIDTMAESLTADFLKPYADDLVGNIGSLLTHDDFKVRCAAMGALAAMAEVLKADFKPYFEKVMTAVGPYFAVKESEDDITLRSSATDAAARLAIAVGSEAFQPYVMDIMTSTEEAINLDNSSLKESTFILWGSVAKVYKKDFANFLPGVFKSLFASLELEEEEIALELTEDEKGLVGTDQEIIAAGKKLKFRNKTEEDDINQMVEGDDSQEDWEDLTASAEALEKEVAIETLGDIFEFACGGAEIQQYLEKAVEMVAPLVDHSYEGCRRTAISTLWRAYQCVWLLMEEETGTKWEPGLPLKQAPTPTLVKLGEIVSKATLQLWPEEAERSVVININSSVMATLKACGPAILEQPDMLKETADVITTLLNAAHPCQQDLGDEDEKEHEDSETSENDWLIMDTAIDVMIGLSAALGPSFADIWPTYQKQVLKLAGSNEPFKRSTAVGTLAEVAANMRQAVTPFTAKMLPILLKRMSDTHLETRSNSAYAVGQLIFNSGDSATYLPQYETIMHKLEPMLQLEGERIKDNASGCLARMVMAHPDKVPLPDVLPALVGLLPLKDDYDENTPVYECIAKLYEQNEPTIQSLTPRLIPVFEAVLAEEPAGQLTAETRTLVCRIVAMLNGAKPDLFQGHEGALRLAGLA